MCERGKAANDQSGRIMIPVQSRPTKNFHVDKKNCFPSVHQWTARPLVLFLMKIKRVPSCVQQALAAMCEKDGRTFSFYPLAKWRLEKKNRASGGIGQPDSLEWLCVSCVHLGVGIISHRRQKRNKKWLLEPPMYVAHAHTDTVT